MTNAETRSEYLARLQQLAADCQQSPPDEPQQSLTDGTAATAPEQLILLADALERLEEEVADLRAAQQSAEGMALALERRVAALEQTTPSPQSWRDLIQGIRGLREGRTIRS
jgi:hypothetical protein